MRWKGAIFAFATIYVTLTVLYKFPQLFSGPVPPAGPVYQKLKPGQPSSSPPPQQAEAAPEFDPEEWPHKPFYTDGTQIKNAIDNTVTLVGINWPGHGLPMIPEGLQYRSIPDIVTMIKDLGMNVVRLTYATEMVDDIYLRGKDVPLKDSFTRALGHEDGTALYDQIVEVNPQFEGDEVTRLDVFNAVAAELAAQGIYIHLDNHISRAGWCCSLKDGNGWFGDTYFDTSNWLRGLRYMTYHASRNWPAFISTSLRNEPRDTPNNPNIHKTYNWATWYNHMITAMQAVHMTDPNALIFMSGLNWDRTLQPVINGEDLGNGHIFNLQQFDENLRRKIVWELHNYNNSIDSCEALEAQLNEGGYSILSSADEERRSPNVNVAPIVLTEFGFPQSTEGEKTVYAQCLKQHLTNLRAGWMYWVLVGSYYEREGVRDYDESWGILNHDWTEWRNGEVVDRYFRPLVADVLGLKI